MTDKARDTKGPVLIELDEAEAMSPADVPPVPEQEVAPTGAAMHSVAMMTARKPSRLRRWFWSLFLAIVGFMLSVAAYDFVTGLIDRNPALGVVALALLVAFLAVALALAVKEMLALVRLKRVDRLQHAVSEAIAHQDLGEARRAVDQLTRFYRGRAELKWGLDRLAERRDDMFDADSLVALAENELMSPLDQAALREVEAAARQVATVTAIVPVALADVIAALTSNIRMIRRVAEIYGGRAGTMGSWRLLRAVMTHLVATGAVAVGDDLLGSLAGGSILSKLSRRFGEGVVNGALTARVGVAAIETCRPLPFTARKRPAVSGIVKRALTGLFGKS
ncbi:YcjF family protein [Aliiroseovarius crassostreae]|uniref:YcjF family protein n=1 Tax=Aliiroseovarius crassostreae TaxID=154981 RepID=UPI003C7EA6C1